MAWKLTVNGVDQTTQVDLVDPPEIELTINERGRATFRTTRGSTYAPDRWDEIVMYAVDGVTALFGGLVVNRSIQQIGTTVRATEVECADFFTYLDWTYVSFSYDTPQTLKTILTEIVSQLPAGHGITVDAGQGNGPTIEPYSVSYMRASDAVRDLTTRSAATPSQQHVARISPAKAIKMFVPGTDSAPFVMNDAAPHCRSFVRSDSTLVPVNTVILLVGTAGVRVTQRWVVAGGATAFVTDFPATNTDPLGVATVNGTVFGTVSGPGGGGMFEWDQSTHTLTEVALPGGLSNGDTIDFDYLPDFPSEVIATSGATPEIQAAFTRPDISTLPDAEDVAEGALATLNQEPLEAEIVSWDHGWLPGQALTVDLTLPDVDTVFTISTVRIQLVTETTWEHTLDATETTTYQGGDLAKWREVLGSGSGGGLTTVGGGVGTTVVTLSSPFPLGGSDQVSQPAGANAWADVLNANDFYAEETQTVTVRTWLWSRTNTTNVQAALFCVTDNANAAESSIIAGGAVRPSDPLEFLVTVEAGKRYRLRQRSHTVGVSPYAIGQLAA